jgi:hypothetical protein
MEVIAVTGKQAAALMRAATQWATRRGAKGGVDSYFYLIPGDVPAMTNTGSSCAGHRLVCVVRGLRTAAGINHKSMGRVVFAKGSDLSLRHPRGVSCYMTPPKGHDPMAKAMGLTGSRPRLDRPLTGYGGRYEAMRRGPVMSVQEYRFLNGPRNPDIEGMREDAAGDLLSAGRASVAKLRNDHLRNLRQDKIDLSSDLKKAMQRQEANPHDDHMAEIGRLHVAVDDADKNVSHFHQERQALTYQRALEKLEAQSRGRPQEDDHDRRVHRAQELYDEEVAKNLLHRQERIRPSARPSIWSSSWA